MLKVCFITFLSITSFFNVFASECIKKNELKAYFAKKYQVMTLIKEINKTKTLSIIVKKKNLDIENSFIKKNYNQILDYLSKKLKGECSSLAHQIFVINSKYSYNISMQNLINASSIKLQKRRYDSYKIRTSRVKIEK